MADVNRYYHKKLLRLGVAEPTDEEAQEMQAEMQAQGPDAQQAYLLAAAQGEQAKAQKAQADTVKTLAQVEETQAKTAEIWAGMDRQERESFMQTLEKIKELATGQPMDGRDNELPPGF